VLHAGTEVAFPFHPAKHGDRLPLGNVVVDVLHTPGHTPEHVCLLVTDRTRADEPWFVLTGHTLMVGDVGRTELAGDAASGARTLFASLQLLKTLPDHIEVLPGAYSGSVCGRRLSGKPSSTIGFERRYNAAFRIKAEAEFVDFMLQDIPPAPVGAYPVPAAPMGAYPVPPAPVGAYPVPPAPMGAYPVPPGQIGEPFWMHAAALPPVPGAWPYARLF